MDVTSFRHLVLTYREYNRLKKRSLMAQKKDQGEIAGAIFVRPNNSLKLVLLSNLSARSNHFEISKAQLTVCIQKMKVHKEK